MKIALLAAANSIHTIRWANGLQSAGHEVHVISQHAEKEKFNKEVRLHIIKYRGQLGYLYMVPFVRKLLEYLKPDIVNAHYASGYGTTAMLVGYRPWLLSVWGSDVYDFPYNSWLHKWLIKTNLHAADAVASTSFCMAVQTRSITDKIDEIEITPFGVEMDVYKSIKPVELHNNKKLVIGTVKTMSHKYGIDTLIEAFFLLKIMLNEEKSQLAERLQLRLVGGGPELIEYQLQANKLGISEQVEFVGKVPHTQVPNELEKMDIYVALSRLDSESFGVAIIEAGAAGRPVVVSDVGGLPEVTLHGQTGLVVSRENPQAAAEAMRTLIFDPALRREMGEAGRLHVEKNYSWSVCVNKMVNVYKKIIEKI